MRLSAVVVALISVVGDRHGQLFGEAETGSRSPLGQVLSIRSFRRQTSDADFCAAFSCGRRPDLRGRRPSWPVVRRGRDR